MQREYRSEGRLSFSEIIVQKEGRRSARVSFSESIVQREYRYSARLREGGNIQEVQGGNDVAR